MQTSLFLWFDSRLFIHHSLFLVLERNMNLPFFLSFSVAAVVATASDLKALRDISWPISLAVIAPFEGYEPFCCTSWVSE